MHEEELKGDKVRCRRLDVDAGAPVRQAAGDHGQMQMQEGERRLVASPLRVRRDAEREEGRLPTCRAGSGKRGRRCKERRQERGSRGGSP